MNIEEAAAIVYPQRLWYYICDACGTIVTITDKAISEDQNWQCECGSESMWEFTDERKALEHSEHIKRGVASGLFRRRS